jgi:hypothetical protein
MIVVDNLRLVVSRSEVASRMLQWIYVAVVSIGAELGDFFCRLAEL